MKAPHLTRRRGFTLLELMVAMAITVIIVTVLVSITSIALGTWNRSRTELRASRMGKMMVDYMARDLESLVTRRGNSNEWLSAISDPDIGPAGLKSTGASRLIFFTAPTDRYEGNAGIPTLDSGGDVCCVAYTLDWKRPVQVGSSVFRTFVLNRKLVDPDLTFSGNAKFKPLLGVTSSTNSLDSVFTGIYNLGTISNSANYTSENIYQFSITFQVQVTDSSGTAPIVRTVPVAMGSNGATSFRVLGTGIETNYSGPYKDLVASGRVTAAMISLTVLSDLAVDQIQAGKRSFTDDKAKAEFLAKNSYNFSKLVQLPGM
ncbi:MAG: prepilin-type N-terminal cleavage/methylation domain-containing protein [Akkermansiaceae bacterium]|nr:prepilin-type N-terminal cleavage/methylation domain-containing protein [Akkermansiaceae bacterium]